MSKKLRKVDLYDEVPATVCTVHRRFVPCRRPGKCVLSQDENDVFEVAVYQLGKGD